MEIIQIKKHNVATYGLSNWEQVGTIAIDFANYLDRLNSIEGINLSDLTKDGWYQVGFKFGKSLIENTEILNLDIVLSRRVKEETFEFGYVSRKIDKKDFLNLIVNFVAQVTNIVHFKADDIAWKELERIEE